MEKPLPRDFYTGSLTTPDTAGRLLKSVPSGKIPRHGESMPVEISGEVPQHLDAGVRKALSQALSSRSQQFVVHVSCPHSELIVDFKKPFARKLKFNHPHEAEIARELYATLTAIVDEAFGSDGRT